MSTTTIYEFSREDALKISRELGNRPDRQHYKPEYLVRSGFNGKWTFWDEVHQKYVPMKPGMKIAKTPEGPRLVP